MSTLPKWYKPAAVVAVLWNLIAQDVALFSRPEVLADMTVVVLQTMVLVIAVLLLIMARKAEGEGWIA